MADRIPSLGNHPTKSGSLSLANQKNSNHADSDSEMTNLFLKKRFLSIVAIPSAVWLLACAIYISVFINWNTQEFYLPHEIAVIVLGIVTPIILILFVFFVVELFSSKRLVASDVPQQGSLIRDVSNLLGKITNETQRNRLYLFDEMDVRKAISKEMANPIETYNAGVKDIIKTLSVVVPGEQERQKSIDPSDVNALAALAQLVNMGLADLSTCITQLLIQLMEAEKRSEKETMEFIEGLVDAWSMGDKNVYFRALHHQLADNPERVKLLQELSTTVPKVSFNVARILRGMKGISSLSEHCDKDTIIRIVVEESDLWSLKKLLERRFKKDGTARA